MIRLPLLVLPAAALVLSACAAGGPPFEDRTVAVPDGRYDYLEGEMPYDTPGMTENEAELVENAGRVPAEPARAADEGTVDPTLGAFDEELFDR